MWHLVIIGITVGVFAAVAPGPINLEIFRRAMTRGPKFGFIFGMGAVSADMFYLTAISMGAAAVIGALPDWGKAVLAFVAAALIAMIGIRALRAKPAGDGPSREIPEPPDSLPWPLSNLSGTGLKRNFLLGLALTLSSPTTILYWLTVSAYTATLFASEEVNLTLTLVLSVGITCTTWVATIVTLAARFHRSIHPRTVARIEFVVGALLLAFAVVSAYQGVRFLSGTPAAQAKVPAAVSAVQSTLSKGFDKAARDTATTAPVGAPKPPDPAR